jgi:hypothetical protein
VKVSCLYSNWSNLHMCLRAGGDMELRQLMLQGLLGWKIEVLRFENVLKGALVVQSLHNPAARNHDVRVLNLALGDFTAPLTPGGAISEAVVSVQVLNSPWPLTVQSFENVTPESACKVRVLCLESHQTHYFDALPLPTWPSSLAQHGSQILPSKMHLPGPYGATTALPHVGMHRQPRETTYAPHRTAVLAQVIEG